MNDKLNTKYNLSPDSSGNLAFVLGKHHFTIVSEPEGYRYTLYNQTYDKVEQDFTDHRDKTYGQVLDELLSMTKEHPVFKSLEGLKQVDYASFIEILSPPDQIAYKLSDGYFTIFASSEGFEYSFFDGNYNLIDGGIYDDDTVSIYTVIQEISIDNLTPLSPQLENYMTLPKVDFAELTEKTEAVEMAKIQQYTATLQNPDHGNLTDNSDHIKVEGYVGTWYVVDTDQVGGKKYFLLEHEEHGDMTACVIVDGKGKLVLNNVWNGFEDLTYYIENILNDYPAPDTIAASEMEQYGYTAPELYPLSRERAEELFKEDLSIYALYNDNTEALLTEPEEFTKHQGYFGIEKVDWNALQDLKANLARPVVEGEKSDVTFSFAKLPNFTSPTTHHIEQKTSVLEQLKTKKTTPKLVKSTLSKQPER